MQSRSGTCADPALQSGFEQEMIPREVNSPLSGKGRRWEGEAGLPLAESSELRKARTESQGAELPSDVLRCSEPDGSFGTQRQDKPDGERRLPPGLMIEESAAP